MLAEHTSCRIKDTRREPRQRSGFHNRSRERSETLRARNNFRAFHHGSFLEKFAYDLRCAVLATTAGLRMGTMAPGAACWKRVSISVRTYSTKLCIWRF